MNTIPENVKIFMPKHQQQIVACSDEFIDVIERLEEEIKKIPNHNEGETVYAHFFYAGCDWFIKDWNREEDILFCYAIINGDVEMSEYGYTALSELVEDGRIELDFYWESCSIKQVLYERYPDYFTKPLKVEIMQNIYDSEIKCTDPDNLQFCLSLSETEFWYCEPNGYNDLVNTEGTSENKIFEKYKGNPTGLIEAAKTDDEVKRFLENRQIWLTGTIDVTDFPHSKKIELLADYGYTWDSFEDDKERNQIICENYFEQNPMDFRNDN